MHLIKGVGARSPVCKDQAETDGLEDTSKGSHCNGVERTLLSEYLRNELDTAVLADNIFVQ